MKKYASKMTKKKHEKGESMKERVKEYGKKKATRNTRVVSVPEL